MNPCPCGTDRAYAACCGRYHAGEAAPDAEALMRSRYTAFVREQADYLLATWHLSRRPASLDFDPGVRWLGLEVKDRKSVDATHAEVAFVARSRDASGRASRLAERSRFVCEDGRWYYVDGRFD